MKSIKKLGTVLVAATMTLGIGMTISQISKAKNVNAVSSSVVISEAYGGGGNSGATYKNDFIELYNLSTSSVDLTGWAVQYTSATGTGTWSVTSLTGSIAGKGYYLIQEAAGTGGTVSLPTPEVIGTIAMSGTAIKVALTNTTTALTGSQATELRSAAVIDFLGAGSTVNAYEGTGPAPAPSNTTSAARKVASGVMQETDENASDFASGAPTPTNSQTSVAVTGVSLNKSTLSLIATQSEVLLATIAPSNATDQLVSWSSSAPSVASVDANGLVVAVSSGETIITVTTHDGGKTATCAVTVSTRVLNSISIKEGSTQKTSFTLGEVFNHYGLVITANYNSGPVDMIRGFALTGVDTLILGSQTATISYEGQSTAYDIDVTNQGASVGTKITSTDLYISEYIEGSSNNKSIEIFNGTGAAVDLSDYALNLHSQPTSPAVYSTTPSQTLVLSGILANGDVYVVSNSSANTDILRVTDVTSGVANFNGDDVVTLTKNIEEVNTIIDIIGDLTATDPGTSWTGDAANGPGSTAEMTIARIPSNLSPNAAFTWSEWNAYAQDTVSYLGTHSIGSADVTSLQQATAFANYVWTGIGNNAIGNCVAVKTELDLEYGYMASDAKTEFNTNPDTLFVNARARMAYLTAWVGASQPGGFLLDTSESSKSALIMSIVIGILGLTTITGFYFLKKKSENA
ncbi:MAG: lamin tail domain-containing protein [Bacilli bacterium]|nr:lamin tail domain-containing protein [Bacilli bacterium]